MRYMYVLRKRERESERERERERGKILPRHRESGLDIIIRDFLKQVYSKQHENLEERKESNLQLF